MYTEIYIMSIAVEAKLVIEMAKTIIYPAAMSYLSDLATTDAAAGAMGIELDRAIAKSIAGNANAMMAAVAELVEANATEVFESTDAHIQYLREDNPTPDGQGQGLRRQAGAGDVRRDLAAAEVPRNAVYSLKAVCKEKKGHACMASFFLRSLISLNSCTWSKARSTAEDRKPRDAERLARLHDWSACMEV